MLLKGEVVKGWGKATGFWKRFPPEYKLLFKDFYPGTLNVKVEESFLIPKDRSMILVYPPFLFKSGEVWGEAKWRSINLLPARVDGVKGFLITLDPPSRGRPPDILEFILRDKVESRGGVEIYIKLS